MFFCIAIIVRMVKGIFISLFDLYDSSLGPAFGFCSHFVGIGWNPYIDSALCLAYF